MVEEYAIGDIVVLWGSAETWEIVGSFEEGGYSAKSTETGLRTIIAKDDICRRL